MKNSMHQGGCQCGSVKYQHSGDPLTCYACHCTDCQTATGSAFTLSMIVNSSDVRVIEGSCRVNTFDHNGTEVQRHHCGSCGSALWYMATAMPDFLALKPGTFADTTWFKPVAHLWLRSAQPWVVLDNEAAKFEKQPEMSELFQLWAASNQ